jgi:antitoxin component YwqK of YwqJK toxin-antitoxin module
MNLIYGFVIVISLLFLPNTAYTNGTNSEEIELRFYIRNPETTNPSYELLFFVSGKRIASRVFKEGKTISEEGEIPNGVVIERYDNGNTKNILIFKNGKRNGKAVGFYESGKLKKTVTFRNDNPVGETRMYYENGNLMMESRIENGKQVYYRDYYPNGQLKQEVYCKGDKIIRKMYDIDGQETDRVVGSFSF